MSNECYVVATIHSWNVAAFERYRATLRGNWHLIQNQHELDADAILSWRPRYVFFPHWSWKIPPILYERLECIGFHAADLPFGRGGSPIQNLIVQGFKETKISAFRVTGELDAGDIYLKRPLSLEGSVEEIFQRCADAVGEMIVEIVTKNPTPSPQIGEPTVFRRRTPDQSEIPSGAPNLEAIYDHIRMLDAPGYPKAFIRFGPYKLTFSRAKVAGSAVEAAVTITRDDEC